MRNRKKRNWKKKPVVSPGPENPKGEIMEYKRRHKEEMSERDIRRDRGPIGVELLRVDEPVPAVCIGRTSGGGRREQIEIRKQDIESEKQDIGVEKQDIQEGAYCTEERFPYELILEENNIKGKTGKNMLNLYRAFQLEHIFSRQDVMDVLKITSSPASVLIKKMKVCGIIEPVKGIGKGRYRFKPY